MNSNDHEKDSWVTRLSSEGPSRDEAITELTAVLSRGLTKSLSKRLSGGLQVEDIVQEAMLKILDSLDSFANRSRFTTWAMTIATRVGISELRRKSYQNVSLDSLTSDEGLSFEVASDDEVSPDAHLDRTKLLGILQKLIAEELTEKQRMATQALLTGMPVEVIAEKIGSNRNAVYKLIHDARVRLKAGFEKAGVVADDFNAIFA